MLVLKEGKQVTDLIFEAKKVAVTASKLSSIDGLCAAYALFKSLKATGKDAAFYYPYDIPHEVNGIINAADISPVVGSRGLMVAIDFGNTNIERIKYSVEGNVCKLILLPSPQNFDMSKVTYSPYGFEYDLLVVIGAEKLAELGVLNREFGDVIKDMNIINIDKSSKNENFGVMNVVEPDSGSLCHMVMHKLSSWHYKIDKEAAKILLTGIAFSENETPPLNTNLPK